MGRAIITKDNNKTAYNNLNNYIVWLDGKSFIDKANKQTITNNNTIISDNAYYFNGSTSALIINSSAFATALTNPHTVSFWVKHDGENGGRAVWFGNYHGGSNLYNLEKHADGGIRYDFGGLDTTASSFKLYDGIWYHLAFSMHSMAYVELYINGTYVWNNTTSRSSIGATAFSEFFIGRDYRTSGEAFKGYIKDFRIFNYALNAKEIFEVMTEGA